VKLNKDNFVYLQFFIAEKLGYTHREIREKMSTQELYAWNAYFQIKSEREEEAYEKAKRQAQTRKVR
jgi:hypothetical protein|tara:strand:+ start:2077 stop:2277 length:201 start_codon:yes stop_codon:yes gene_type:complete